MLTQPKPGGLPTDFVNMYKNAPKNTALEDGSPPAVFVAIGIILGVMGLVTLLNGVYLAAI